MSLRAKRSQASEDYNYQQNATTSHRFCKICDWWLRFSEQFLIAWAGDRVAMTPSTVPGELVRGTLIRKSSEKPLTDGYKNEDWLDYTRFAKFPDLFLTEAKLLQNFICMFAQHWRTMSNFARRFR